jgi:hypothetical protein
MFLIFRQNPLQCLAGGLPVCFGKKNLVSNSRFKIVDWLLPCFGLGLLERLLFIGDRLSCKQCCGAVNRIAAPDLACTFLRPLVFFISLIVLLVTLFDLRTFISGLKCYHDFFIFLQVKKPKITSQK